MQKKSIQYSFDTIVRIAKDVKKQGGTVGLTHGAFDLFHPGHLDMIEKSSALCDFMIVGVESDKNIKLYKGDKRPIMNEEFRFNVVNSVGCVGATFVNKGEISDHDYSKLYKTLQIDVLTYGFNFGFVNYLENRSQKVGCELVQVTQKEDVPSTTKIIEDIINSYSSNLE